MAVRRPPPPPTHRECTGSPRSSRPGIVWVKSWFLRDLRTAFGGMKHSGIGREGGVHGLEFYTETSNVCVKI